jgi:hypothetical protein
VDVVDADDVAPAAALDLHQAIVAGRPAPHKARPTTPKRESWDTGPMKWFWLGTSAMALVVGLAVFWPAQALSPEDQIRALLNEGVAALEAQDVAGAADLLHDDYKDGGGRTKSALKGVTFMALRRGPVFIGLTKVDIAVDGARATADVEGVALQGQPEVKVARDLLPERGRAFDVTVALTRVDDDTWRVTAIDGLSASFLD